MDKLTNQDKVFVKELVETGNKTQSALKAYKYKNENTAGVQALEKLRNPKIQKAIQTLAERIPDDKLHEVLMEGLGAGKTIYKNNNSTKEIEEVGYEPDYAVRHKYLDTALKLKGLYEVDEQKNINVFMPVLVKFLDKKDDTTSNNGDTNRIS
jgi:hypothetical protein